MVESPVHPESKPEPASWRRAGLEVLALVALALTLNLAGNGRISLWDRDEPRYAGAVREMRASGDYIHPTFNAEPRYHKPILIYWLMLAATAVAGDNPFGARLVSALSGAAACGVVWWLGRRWYGPKVGRFAALVMATAPIVFAESKLATTDAFLMLCLIVCQAALWELSQKPSKRWAAAFWVGLGLAFMTKGPIGPAILGAANIAAWVFRAPWNWWPRLRWRWGIAVFTLICAPWYIAIGIISHGDYYRVSMGYHVYQRMTTSLESHGGWPGYYLTLSLPLFYPWSVLLPAALLAAWQRRRERPELGFLLGWIIGPIVLLELVQTKLIHYVLPVYPACALLVGWMIVAVSESEVNLRRWTLGRLGLGLLTGIGIGLTVMLVAGAMVVPNWTLAAPCLALAMVLGIGTLVALEGFQKGATERAALVLTTTWALMLGIGAGWFVPLLEPYRLSPVVARHLVDAAKRNPAGLMMAGYKPPSVVYHCGRPLAVFAGRKDLLERLERDGPLISALTPDELAGIKKDRRVNVAPIDLVEGYDVEHARTTTLHLVLMRAEESSQVTRATFEETRVK